MKDQTANSITSWEFDVLQALNEAKNCPESSGYPNPDSVNGWFLATQLSDRNLINGPKIRPALIALCDAGYATNKVLASGRYFKINAKGLERLKVGYSAETEEAIIVNTSSWTGVVDPVQVSQVLTILSDMEDACERISNNHERAQIFGLIRALEILITLPEPPRQGVVSLLRDPAFANVVQIATFLAALLAAVRP